MARDDTRTSIADRLRALVLAAPDSSTAEVAYRLGVNESALKASVDDLAPLPTVDVLAAVVREYGVDPSWLVTGVYSEATHRRALESSHEEIVSAIHALVSVADNRFSRPWLRSPRG